MFPHMIGSVRYDIIASAWVLEGIGATSVALNVVEADPADDEIIAAVRPAVGKITTCFTLPGSRRGARMSV